MKSGKNYFVCNRSLFKNPLWYSEKFTKGQAWVDLFGNANHSDGWFEKNNQRVDVKRGQTGRSIESLGEDWKWSRNKVKRFLKRLEDDHMIDRKPNHLTTVITICNYDKYQFDEKTNGPSNEPPNEPSDELQTIKKKERKKKEVIKYSEDSNEFRLSLFLLKHIRKNKPDYKEPNLQKWSKDADLLLNKDKRDLGEAKRLIKWVQSDDFEMVNVLSISKLMKRYDQLVIKMNKDIQKPVVDDGSSRADRLKKKTKELNNE